MFEITLSQYDIKSGIFFDVITKHTTLDYSTPILLFLEIAKQHEVELKNKFFLFTIIHGSSGFQQYKVRTDKYEKVIQFLEINPNSSIPKTVLVDAILGCNIPDDFIPDKSLSKCIYMNILKWTEDARERLLKFDILRLNELYENLKS